MFLFIATMIIGLPIVTWLYKEDYEMTTIHHTTEQTYHIYRTRKHVRIAYNPTWVFQHGFKDLWFIAYEDELSYENVEALDFEYIGCMTRSKFEEYCNRCYPVASRV